MPLSELPFTHGSWLVFLIIGGLVAVDAVSWPQVMVSRPLVSATLGGALVGAPDAGLLVGAILELLAMRHPPFGAARYPDTGPAGLIAGASFGAAGGTGLGPLLAAVIGGWCIGWIGSVSVYARRRFNERLVAPAADLAARPELLERRHKLAIWLDVLRGAFLVSAFLIPVAVVTALAAGATPRPTVAVAGAFVLVVVVAASSGAAGRVVVTGLRGWSLLLGGGAIALVFLAVSP